jgi:hypothetical protein
MKKLYIKVSKDKYRLPLAVADSVPELSRMTGVSINVIASAISKGCSTYERVIIDDLEEEE